MKKEFCTLKNTPKSAKNSRVRPIWIVPFDKRLKNTDIQPCRQQFGCIALAFESKLLKP